MYPLSFQQHRSGFSMISSPATLLRFGTASVLAPLPIRVLNEPAGVFGVDCSQYRSGLTQLVQCLDSLEPATVLDGNYPFDYASKLARVKVHLSKKQDAWQASSARVTEIKDDAQKVKLPVEELQALATDFIQSLDKASKLDRYQKALHVTFVLIRYPVVRGQPNQVAYHQHDNSFYAGSMRLDSIARPAEALRITGGDIQIRKGRTGKGFRSADTQAFEFVCWPEGRSLCSGADKREHGVSRMTTRSADVLYRDVLVVSVDPPREDAL